jgi:hypothetical protein
MIMLYSPEKNSRYPFLLGVEWAIV